MAKLLAIAALAAALTAALTALVLVDAAKFFAVAVALSAGVVLLMQRNLAGWLGGGAVILLAVLGALGATGNVTTKGGGGGGLGVSQDWASALLTASLVLVPAFAAWSAWGTLTPWAAYLAIGAGLVAAVLAFVAYDRLVDQTDGMAIAVGVFCLATAVPAGMMLRGPAAAPAAEEPAVRKPAAKRKAD